MAQDVTVGKLKLEADVTGIKKMTSELKNLKHQAPETEGALKEIQGAVGDMLLEFVAIGAIIEMVKSFGEMIMKTAEFNEQLGQMSEALGVPIEKLQVLQTQMGLAGIGGDAVTKSLQKLAIASGQAISQPIGEAANAFKQLGISQEELKKGNLSQIYDDAVKGFSKYADSAQKTAEEVKLLGKKGPLIVSVAAETAGSYKSVSQALDDYGAKVTEADVKSATLFNGTMKMGGQVIGGMENTITNALLPGLTALATGFIDSAKKGGTLYTIIQQIETIAIQVGKALILGLGAAVIFVGTEFTVFESIAIHAMHAIKDALHGNFKGALDEVAAGVRDVSKAYSDQSTEIADLATKLYGNTDATTKSGEAAGEAKKQFTAFSQAGVMVGDTIDKFTANLKAQRAEQAASVVSLDAYKKAQAEVAISTEVARLVTQGATKAQIEHTVALMRDINVSKEATTENIAGQNLLLQLQGKINDGVGKQTELMKVQAEIAKDPQMDNNLKNELIQKAKILDATSKQNDYDKANLAIQNLIGFNIDKQTAALGKSNQEMIVWNQQAALKNALDKDLEKQVITQDQYNKLLIAGNAQIVKENENLNALYTTSQAFTQGFSKGLKDNLNDSENLNKLGLDASNKLITDGTTAFMNMGTQGAASFKTLLASMLTFMEQYIIKLEITKALQAASGMSMFSTGGIFGGSSPTPHANGGAFYGGITAFADGGVVDKPTTFNMGLMGEAGPEAIMPLTRDATGSLGVKVAGGGSGANQGVQHYNPITIQVNSSQDPHAVAAETKKVFNQAQMISKKTISDSRRPGGMLSNNNGAFSRG